MELKLKSVGFEVLVVGDGKQAVEELKKGSIDLMLLDLVMPIADGFFVLEYMSQTPDKTPTIVMSNLSQPEDRERAKALGASHFFTKSDSSLAEIVEKVQDLLSK